MIYIKILLSSYFLNEVYFHHTFYYNFYNHTKIIELNVIQLVTKIFITLLQIYLNIIIYIFIYFEKFEILKIWKIENSRIFKLHFFAFPTTIFENFLYNENNFRTLKSEYLI